VSRGVFFAGQALRIDYSHSHYIVSTNTTIEIRSGWHKPTSGP
jgi:hypothetical protein